MAHCTGQVSKIELVLFPRLPGSLARSKIHQTSGLCSIPYGPQKRSQVRSGAYKLKRGRATDTLIVRAEANGEADQGASESQYGLGPGSFFGFGVFQERLVGRFAMVGVVAALVMEVVTGKGIFGQLGLDPVRVRYPVLLGFTFLLVAGLLGGYVVIKNPPDESKAPPNAGAGIPRDPLKTFDANNMETMTTYTRGGVVDRPSGQKGREPYVSDLEN